MTESTDRAEAPPTTNHILHLLLSIVTLGLWLPVWLIISIVNRNRADRELPPVHLSGSLIVTAAVLGVIAIIFLVARLTGVAG